MLRFPFPPGPAGTPPAVFDELRDSAPVAGVRLPDGKGIHLVSRYPDVVTVLTDPRFSRAAAAALPGSGFGRSQRTGLLDLDPPAHGTLRGPLDRALDAGSVQGWLPALDDAIGDQLAELAGSPQPADLVAGFTRPLAARVTCLTVGLDGVGWPVLAGAVDRMLAAESTPEQAGRARAELAAMLADLVDRRRAEPRGDIASTLLAAGDGQPGLSGEDTQLVLFGLLLSGYIGIRNALARHTFALLSTGQLADLAAEPELAGTAVEELLRYYPSGNDGLLRVVTAPAELSGVRLTPGDVVMPLMAAAGRDPQVFDRPGALDLRRCPNPHLSLGAGPHACPGNTLIRTLWTRALVQLASILPGLRLAVPADQVEHTSDLLPLGLRALPVSW
jgi:cytochrome P450